MKPLSLYDFLKNISISLILILLFALFSIIFTSCSGCSRSGIRNKLKQQNITFSRESVATHSGKCVVKMYKENGVYKIPVEINGTPMRFIFDTGAGIISISATEARYLYKQGLLMDEDFMGTEKFMDANGDISEGTIVRFKSIKIGDRILCNIQASIVHNGVAPLLFGQSALEKFGKITIDYQKCEIVFE